MRSHPLLYNDPLPMSALSPSSSSSAVASFVFCCRRRRRRRRSRDRVSLIPQKPNPNPHRSRTTTPNQKQKQEQQTTLFFLQREMEKRVCRNTVSKKGELRFPVAAPFFSVKLFLPPSLFLFRPSSFVAARKKGALIYTRSDGHRRTGVSQT